MFAPRFSPWLRLLWFGVGAAFASSAFQVVIVAALTYAAILSGQNPEALRAEGFAHYALWITVLSYPPIWLWLMFCRRHFDRRSVRSLGLRLEDSARSLGGGILAGVLAIAWLFGALWLCGGVRFSGLSPDAFDQSTTFILGQLGLYALLFACVGFMEEAIFRGYALHNLSAAVGLRSAIWLQAIGFAAIHLSNAAIQSAQAPDAAASQTIWLDAWRAMPSIALIGAIFALCWAKTGSLWFSIGFHAAWNWFLGCLFSLPVSGLPTFRLFDIAPVGNHWLNGGSFGAEGSVLLWPILGLLLWSLQRVPDHPQIARDLALLDSNFVFTLPVSTPAPILESETDDEAPRQSRFKTSMRGRDDESTIAAVPFPVWGQLPRETAPITDDFAPTSFLSANSSPETAAPAMTIAPVVSAAPANESALWEFEPLKISARSEAPVVTETPILAPDISPVETANESTETDASAPLAVPVETEAAPVAKPRPPAPRW